MKSFTKSFQITLVFFALILVSATSHGQDYSKLKYYPNFVTGQLVIEYEVGVTGAPFATYANALEIKIKALGIEDIVTKKEAIGLLELGHLYTVEVPLPYVHDGLVMELTEFEYHGSSAVKIGNPVNFLPNVIVQVHFNMKDQTGVFGLWSSNTPNACFKDAPPTIRNCSNFTSTFLNTVPNEEQIRDAMLQSEGAWEVTENEFVMLNIQYPQRHFSRASWEIHGNPNFQGHVDHRSANIEGYDEAYMQLPNLINQDPTYAYKYPMIVKLKYREFADHHAYLIIPVVVKKKAEAPYLNVTADKTVISHRGERVNFAVNTNIDGWSLQPSIYYRILEQTNISFEIEFGPNSSDSRRTFDVVVMGGNDAAPSKTVITQMEKPVLKVTPNPVTVEAEEDSVIFTVESNMEWGLQDVHEPLRAFPVPNSQNQFVVKFGKNPFPESARAFHFTVVGVGSKVDVNIQQLKENPLPFLEIAPESKQVAHKAGELKFFVNSNTTDWKVEDSPLYDIKAVNKALGTFTISYQANPFGADSPRTIDVTVSSQEHGISTTETIIQLRQSLLHVTPNPATLSANEELDTFEVEANMIWRVEGIDPNLVNIDANKFTVRVGKNPFPDSPRAFQFFVVGEDGSRTTVEIRQFKEQEQPFLELTADRNQVDHTAGHLNFTVNTNVNWEVEPSPLYDTTAVDKAMGRFTISYQANPFGSDSERPFEVKIRSSDGLSASVTIIQLRQPLLHVTPNPAVLTAEEEVAYFEVETNMVWKVEGIDPNMVNIQGSRFTVQVGKNPFPDSPRAWQLFVVGSDGRRIEVIISQLNEKQLPDYQVTKITQLPNEVCAGKRLNFSADITNLGDMNENSASKAFYILSGDEILGNGDDVKLGEDNMPGLKVGQTNTDREVITIPSDRPEGLHTLFYIADATGIVAESNESNNVYAQRFMVKRCANNHKKADYKVHCVRKLNGTVCPGMRIQMWAEIRNCGSKSHSDWTKAYYWISSDDKLDKNSARDRWETRLQFRGEMTEDNIKPLKVGGRNIDREYIEIPDLPDGTYYLIYEADAKDQIDESDEENNVYAQRIQIRRHNGARSARATEIDPHAVESPDDINDDINTKEDLWTGASLDQNYPNPVVDQTTIPLNIPNEVTEAVLIITGSSGQVARSITVDQRGTVELQLNDLNLTDGIWMYSLILDQKLFATKRMLIAGL